MRKRKETCRSVMVFNGSMNSQRDACGVRDIIGRTASCAKCSGERGSDESLGVGSGRKAVDVASDEIEECPEETMSGDASQSANSQPTIHPREALV